MTCSTCKHWKLGTPKNPEHMTRYGFAACKFGKSYEYLPLRHVCGRHEALDPVKAARRVEQLQKLGVAC